MISWKGFRYQDGMDLWLHASYRDYAEWHNMNATIDTDEKIADRVKRYGYETEEQLMTNASDEVCYSFLGYKEIMMNGLEEMLLPLDGDWNSVHY